MSLRFIESDDRIIKIIVTGTLCTNDYDDFLPDIERLIKQHGKVRVLVMMEGFNGSAVGDLWADIKFDVRHFSDLERIAMVGDKSWEKWMAWFCKPFTTASIRRFDMSELADAKIWIEEESLAVEEDHEKKQDANFFQA
jgi:hypothetical protein